jgi:hypothetical protein
MTLKILMIEEEPEQEISYVTRVEDDTDASDADMELPGNFTIEDDLKELDEASCALESIGTKIACEGIDLATARELDKVIPGFMRKAGGANVFTSRPSLEGLTEANTSIADRLKGVIERIFKMVADLYKRFRDWLKSKLSNPKALDISEELNSFLAERRNQDALTYVVSLPDDVREAAKEVARFMDGETTEFASALANQLAAIDKTLASLETAMEQNPTQYRVARGIMSVQDVFTQKADEGVRVLLEQSLDAADKAVRFSQGASADKNAQLLELVTNATNALVEFKKNMVVNDTASSSFGDDRAVPVDKLLENIRQAGDELKRYDVARLIQDSLAVLEKVIAASESKSEADVLKAIGGDNAQEGQAPLARQLTVLYKEIAEIGQASLRLWRIRITSVQTLNQVGDALMDVTVKFTQAVTTSAQGLAQEQKDQLVQALRKKGMTVAF